MIAKRKETGVVRKVIVLGLSIMLFLPASITNVSAKSGGGDEEAKEVQGIGGEVELKEDQNIDKYKKNISEKSGEGDQETKEVQGIPGEVELDDDPNIAEWQKLQYGMFIHWGLYSELGGEWNGEPVTDGYSEQIKMWADISDEDYLDIANNFS